MTGETRTYWAISIFSSKTFWVNAVMFFVAVGSATDVLVFIPAKFMPQFTATVTIANIILRFATVRPVALITPGTTKPVEVAKLDTPPAVLLGD